jgi:hypothetical protein
MAEWHVKGVDEELAKRVKEFRRARGLTLKGLLVGAVLGVVEGDKVVNNVTQSSPKEVNKVTRSSPAAKFTPPSEAEADAEIAAKGYHFTGKDFVAWNGTRGWRTKQGPMKDWKQAMVTWESRWKEAGGANGQQRREFPSEQRLRENIENLNELFPVDRGTADAADGGEGREGGKAAAADVRGRPPRLTP